MGSHLILDPLTPDSAEILSAHGGKLNIEDFIMNLEQRPWYMKGGKVRKTFKHIYINIPVFVANL